MTTNEAPKPNLQRIVKPYSSAVEWKSWWQLANTLIPLLMVYVASYFAYSYSLLLTGALCMVAGLLVTRTFIIMHDCGHGSFFKSRQKRDIFGTLTGIICFTPYHQWTREHAAHHQHSGDLDYRGRGDVWTMTLEEYKSAGKLERLQYYLYRHPIITFIVGPIFIFQFRHRISLKTDRKIEKKNIYFTNLCLFAIFGTLTYLFGWKQVLFIHGISLFTGELVGCLLFYVQHQYEEVYWAKGDHWDYNTAALDGCSYLKLPKVLQWFTGNIGFHHIHHLNHKVPNYNLEKCYEENGIFQNVITLGIRDFIPCINMKIYNEETGRMLTWSQVKAVLKEQKEEVAIIEPLQAP